MNIWAVLVAALTCFLLGGLWYSPALFGRIWNRENGSQPQHGHPAKVFGLSLLFAVIGAIAFAYWVGPAPSLETALVAGLIAGLGFTATSFGINYQFAQRSFKLWLIDGGYHTCQFLLYGLVFGLWP